MAGSSKTKLAPLWGSTAPHSQKLSKLCSKGHTGLMPGRVRRRRWMVGRLEEGQYFFQAAVVEGGECGVFFLAWLLRATLSLAPRW